MADVITDLSDGDIDTEWRHEKASATADDDATDAGDAADPTDSADGADDADGTDSDDGPADSDADQTDA